MRTKHVVFPIVATLLLGLLVAPASANKIKDKDGIPGGVKDTGTFTGTGIVGKFRSFCTHEGDSDVHGPGIGVPFQPTKNAYYELETVIDSAFKPGAADGLFKICGRLTKMADTDGETNGGLGAACGASKGWDGRGTIDWDDDRFPEKDTIWLKDLVWKADVSGTWIVTGEANEAEEEVESKEKGKQDFITMTIQAQGFLGCLTKAGVKPHKSGGATQFVMVGEYTIANGTADQNVGPLCKSGLDDGCLYDEKRVGKSG